MRAGWPGPDADLPGPDVDLAGDDPLRRRLAAAPGPEDAGASTVVQVAHRVERRAARRRATLSAGAVVAGIALLGGGVFVVGAARQGGASTSGVAASAPGSSASGTARPEADAMPRGGGGSVASAAGGAARDAATACPAELPVVLGAPVAAGASAANDSTGRLVPPGGAATALICRVDGAGSTRHTPPMEGRRVAVEESWLNRVGALTAQPSTAGASVQAGCATTRPGGPGGGYLVRLDDADGSASWLLVPDDPCGRLTTGRLSAPHDPAVADAVRRSAEAGVPLRG